MKATQIKEIREITTQDGEDRLIETADGWYWQTRGTADVVGPFETDEDAAKDNERPLADFR